MSRIPGEASPIEDLIAELNERVLRPGQPPYQSMNELGCFAELIHNTLARTFGESAKKRDLSFWKGCLKNHGHRCPPSFDVLHTTYGWRNKCSHPTDEKETFTRDFVRANLVLLVEALGQIDAELSSTAFRRNLLQEQPFCRSIRLAATLEAALHKCTWTPELDQALVNYAATALLPAEFMEALRLARSLEEELAGELLSTLARKDLNDTANHIHQLAQHVAAVVPSHEFEEHLSPWFERNKLNRSSIETLKKLPTLRLTLNADEGAPGEFWITAVELLHPPHIGLSQQLAQWEDRLLRTPQDLVREIKTIGNCLADRGAAELDEYVIQIRVPPEHAAEEFHGYEAARTGVPLGEHCRCLTVQLLLPPHEDRAYTRRAISAPLRRPDARPTRTAIVDGPVRKRAIYQLWRKQRFECLFALGAAASNRVAAQKIIDAFEGYPLSILDRSGRREPAEFIDDLFDGEDTCGLDTLFRRITELRHPDVDSSEGLPLIVLWDDKDYQPHQPSYLSR